MEYKFEIIKKQAEYCLDCKTKPCKKGCPLKNNIPDFIRKIKDDKPEEAFQILSETTIFEPICGRICPQKKQCEGSCVRARKGESVSIGKLERFIGDYALENFKFENKNNKYNEEKVAIIGSGPAGLAAAHYLSKKGYRVTIFEKHSKLGGLLRHGIPEFRLEKKILDDWLNKFILNEDIEIILNKKLGADIFLKNLKEEFDAVLLTIGANVSNKMNIPGENDNSVLGGNELLEYREFPDLKNKKVAIIGGGNVAIDCARTVKRLGAKNAIVIYRRNREEMPAEEKEIEEAIKDKVNFLFQTNILQIKEYENKNHLDEIFDKDNKRKHIIKCIRTKLVKQDGEERKYPVNIENSEFEIGIDYIIMAIGSKTNEDEINYLDILTDEKGYIKINDNYETSQNRVFAAGDLVGNKQTVAWAAKSGYEAAEAIERFLENRK